MEKGALKNFPKSTEREKWAILLPMKAQRLVRAKVVLAQVLENNDQRNQELRRGKKV